jgi:hypothetical protein
VVLIRICFGETNIHELRHVYESIGSSYCTWLVFVLYIGSSFCTWLGRFVLGSSFCTWLGLRVVHRVFVLYMVGSSFCTRVFVLYLVGSSFCT